MIPISPPPKPFFPSKDFQEALDDTDEPSRPVLIRLMNFPEDLVEAYLESMGKKFIAANPHKHKEREWYSDRVRLLHRLVSYLN